MTRWPPHDFAGQELDWLAHDLDGLRGYFCSAGFGPVPEVAAQSLRDDLEAAVLALPIATAAHWVGGPHINVGHHFEIARRGFFAFDWDDRAKRYLLIAAPSSAAALPPGDVRDLALRTVLATRFARATELDPSVYG